jgi:hypothetical protein
MLAANTVCVCSIEPGLVTLMFDHAPTSRLTSVIPHHTLIPRSDLISVIPHHTLIPRSDLISVIPHHNLDPALRSDQRDPAPHLDPALRSDLALWHCCIALWCEIKVRTVRVRTTP